MRRGTATDGPEQLRRAACSLAPHMVAFMVSQCCCDSHGEASVASSVDEFGSECSFRVVWSINPHMVVGGADPDVALRQHAAFLSALENAGAELTRMPFVHGAFDSVFAKDAAILRQVDGEYRALLARPRHRERRAEIRARAEHLSRLGYAIDESRDFLEGGDVVVAGAELAFLGYGFRSDRSVAAALSSFLDVEVMALELRDPLLYHLDTALTVLRDGTLLYCVDAFTPATLRRLRSLPFRRFEVAREDAIRFAVNLVEIGDTIVTGTDAPRVTAELERIGRRVQVVALDEFHRAGGSAACLVAPLANHGRARIRKAA